MSTITEANLKILRTRMKTAGIKSYYVGASDPHGSEYVARYYLDLRLAICPFTGTDGYLLITEKEALLFTDGRYFIQADNELAGSSFKLMKMGTPGYPTIQEYVKANDLYPLGLDTSLVSSSFATSLMKKDEPSSVIDLDFTDILDKRSELPQEKVWPLEQRLYKTSAEDQVEYLIKEHIVKNGADALLITSLTDIAYVLNLRGRDIPSTPVFMSYLLITTEGTHLFIDEKKVEGVKLPDFIKVHPYNDIYSYIKQSGLHNIMLDPSKVNYRLISSVDNIIARANPTELTKAVKDDVMIENIKRIHELDGVAMVKFIRFLEENNKEITEYELAKVLADYRLEAEDCYDLSFSTIAAIDQNAALMHYEGTEEKCSTLTKESKLLLVDSGGQYMGGTTDITRTFILGEPSEELRHDYTLTLKSLINLSTSIFHEGSSGQTLDIKAREIMWREGLDYKCGTGHGVGYMLSVHEGPNGFRYVAVSERNDSGKLQLGMVTTIEPGVYKAYKYGIRIENEILTVLKREVDTDRYFGFETITYCPIETKYLELSILTDEEIDFINDYHKMVFDRLVKYFKSEDEISYLKKLCQKVVR